MNRLEYIIWRDTIKYKYQLDKTLQLSEQEIEEKIDELERAISESMPYFFEGKDSIVLKSNIDHNLGFDAYTGVFVATEEDYCLWYRDESFLLFCGDSGCIVINNLRDQYMKCLLSHSMSIEELRKKKLEQIRLSQPFHELSSCSLRTYQDIISRLRSFEYYNNVDFTNFENVKKIFKENYIYTGNEFRKQNGYYISSKRCELPDGQKVRIFKYERSEYGYSEEDDNDVDLFDE